MKSFAEQTRTKLLTPDTKRPYRLWHSKEQRDMLGRYYLTRRRALETALILVHWEPVLTVIDIYNTKSGKLSGSYLHHADGSITFRR